jgi:hypothetical protein
VAVRQVDDHEDHQLTLENYLIRIISILVLCAATLYAQTPAKRENKQAPDAKQSAETPSTPPVKPDSAAKSSAPPVVNGKPIPRDLALFTEEMDNDLDGYIRAEITKKKLPIRVVLNFEDADLEMTGSSTPEEKRKWH